MIKGCITTHKAVIEVNDELMADKVIGYLTSLNKLEFFDYLKKSLETNIHCYAFEVHHEYEEFGSIEDAQEYAELVANACDTIAYAPDPTIDTVEFYFTQLHVYDEEYDDYFTLEDLDEGYHYLDGLFSNVYRDILI